jgi:hypothetical protein
VLTFLIQITGTPYPFSVISLSINVICIALVLVHIPSDTVLTRIFEVRYGIWSTLTTLKIINVLYLVWHKDEKKLINEYTNK